MYNSLLFCVKLNITCEHLSGFLEAVYKIELNLGYYRVYTVKRCQVFILRISHRI